MDCVNCGAPLPPRSNTCGHCQTLNDVDLRAIHANVKPAGPTHRACPRCAWPMQAVELGGDKRMTIERCEKCMGIFFDPGELDVLIDTSVRTGSEVDYQRLQQIVEEESMAAQPPTEYVKCPECLKMMNRKRYGSRAGVIVDRCRDHGVWLDGGELGQILKWAHAGGREHDAKKRARERAEAERAERTKRVTDRMADYGGVDDRQWHFSTRSPDLFDLVRVVIRTIR